MSVTVSAVATSFTAGVTSFFAPCAFPLLPGYIGYYIGEVEGEPPLSGVVVRGVAGSGGIVLAFAGITGLVALVGRSIVASISVLEPVVGVLLIVAGFALLLDRFQATEVALPKRRSSVSGFVIFGAGYAIAATSCFAPVFFAVVLGSATVSLQQTLFSIAAFGIGLAAPLALTTVVAGIGYDIGSSTAPGYAASISKWAGIVIIGAGVWQVARTVQLL